MAGVQRLQQVERFRAAHFADQNPVGPVPQRGAEQVGDRDRRQRRFLAERGLRAPRLEPHEVRLVDQDLGRLLDEDDAVVGRNRRRQRIEQRGLAGAGAAGDQDVLLARDCRGRDASASVARQRADVDEVVAACSGA